MVLRRLVPLVRRVGTLARPVAALLVAAIVGLVVARSGLVTAEQLGPLVADMEVAAAPDPMVAVAPSSLDGLPAVDHAGLRVALIEARTVSSNSAGQPIVVADLAVGNDRDRALRLTRSMVRLIGPEDVTTEPTRFDHTVDGSRLVVAPGATGRALAVFILRPGADLDLGLYRLEIGEPGRWPSNLPLDGEPPPDIPARMVAPLDGFGAEPGPVAFGATTFEVVGATVDIEHGAYRARVGRHVLAVTVEVIGARDSIADLLDAGIWELVGAVEAGPVAPGRNRALGVVHDTWRSRSGRGAGPATLTVVFVYPDEATDLVVVVHADDSALPLARFDVRQLH